MFIPQAICNLTTSVLFRNAFADLADNSDLDKALGLSGSDFQNNSLTVEKAKPRQPRQDNNSSFGGNQSFNSSFGGDESKK